MSSLAQKIKVRASELGFSGIGIVPVAALDNEGRRVNKWLENGYHGTMA